MERIYTWFGGRKMFLGRFKTAVEAAIAYAQSVDEPGRCGDGEHEAADAGGLKRAHDAPSARDGRGARPLRSTRL